METASEGCDLDLLTKLQNKTLDSADLSTDARTVSDSTSVVTGSAEPPEDSTSTDDVISSSVKEMDVTSSNRGLCPNEQITALDNVSDVDSNIDKLKPSEVTESADCPDGDKDGDPMEVEGEPDVDVNKVIRDLGELNQIAEPMLGQNEEQTTDIDRSIVRETVQQQYTETDHQAEEMEHQPMEAESSVPEESSVTENQLENESSPSLAEHHRQLPTCGVKSEQLADGLDEVDACQPTEASHQYQSDPGITSASAVHGLSEGQVGQSTEGQISCDKGESSEMVCVSDIKQEVNNEVSSQGDELVSDVSDRSNDQTSDQQVAEKAKASCNVTLTVDDEKEPEVLLSSDDDAPSAKTIPEKQQNNSDEDVSFISEETKGKDSGAGDQENVVYSSNSADKSVVKTSSEKTMHPCLVCNKELSDNERCCKGDSKEGFLNLLTLTSRESAAAVAESMLAKSEASQISILPSVKRRIRRAPIKLEDEMEIGPPKGRKRSVKCGKVGTPKVKDLLSLNRETKSCSKGQKVFYEDLQPVKDPDNKLSDSTGETLDVKDSFIKSCISPASVADYGNTGSCVSREKSSSASAFVVQDRSCSSVSSQDTLSDGEVCTKKLVGQQHSVEAGLTASIDKSNSESVRRSRRERKLTEKAASWVAARQGQDEVPIISDVVSLANKVPETKLTLAQQVSSSSAQTTHIIVQPPKPRHIKNKSLLCKPLCQTKATSCRPHMQTKSTQTDSEYEQQKVLVPVPVPIYIPTPMAMYAAPQPYPIPIPVPIPIPCFIPTTKQSADAILKQIKEIREQMPADPFEAELLMMAEAVATADQCDTNISEDEEEKAEDGTAPLPVAQAEAEPLKFPASPEVTTTVTQPGEIGEDMLQMALRMASEISEEPVLDLEESLNPAPIQTNPVTVAQEAGAEFSTIDQSNAILTNTSSEASRHCRGRRGRGGRGGRGRVKRPRVSEEPLVTPQETVVVEPKPAADANTVLKYMYGVNAWKHWVAQKNALLEKSANTNKGKVKLFKTDILACTTEELNYSLSLFVKEFRKPNGEEYAPDSIFYLCLGIQQYLYENGRIDDIFSSFYYEGFTNALNDVLAGYEMRLNAHGLLVCRIEEEHLWESKQLGAHSPYILLNTLIYFNTKYFFLKTPEEHLRLSFSHIMKHWKRANGQPVTAKQPAQGQAKNVYLRYYAPTVTGPPEPGQKRKREEAPVYEQAENTENPLRCPVKLYEFYLSKCPESIKHRNDVFYLLPERSCVPDSPVWYSTSALSLETMTKMLNRLRLVREIQEAHFHNAPAHYGI